MKNKITIATAFLVVMFAMIGMASAASISGMKFNDLNHNGIRDPGEPGLANWTIILTKHDGSTQNTTTNSDGFYTFSNLSAGNYTVGEVLKPGWNQTAPVGGTYNVTIAEEDVAGRDFGNFNASHGTAQALTFNITASKPIEIQFLSQLPPVSPEEQKHREEMLNETHRHRPMVPIVKTPVGPSGGETNITNLQPNITIKSNITNLPFDAPGDFKIFQYSTISANALKEHQRIVDEPSVANKGDTIFYTGNLYAARSTNGGSTWSVIDPFHDMSLFCCDQDVIYDQSRDIFIWSRQSLKNPNGVNFFRLVILNDKGAHYWDFYPTSVDSSWTNQHWDLPQLALSNNYLYIAVDMWDNTQNCNGNCWIRSVLLRLPLDALATGSGLGIDYIPWTDNYHFGLVQGATTTMYWGSHKDNTNFRLFSWDESSTVYSWYDNAIAAWTPTDIGHANCPGPDEYNWCGFSDDNVALGGWVANGIIGFFWNVKQNEFQYPYVESAIFDEISKSYVGRPYISNSNYAWQYAAVSPNARGDLGLAAFWGGGPSWNPSYAVGILDEFTNTAPPPWQFWLIRTGTNGPANQKWGDYIRVRKYSPSDLLWIASGYTLQGGSTNKFIEPFYVVFGRERDTPEFSIFANPSSLIASPGTYATGLIVAFRPISLSIGGDVAVSLSASGLPSGATVSFSPNPVVTTSGSIMTIQTSPTTPLGTYTITVTGTELGITRSTQVTLTVIPQTHIIKKFLPLPSIIQNNIGVPQSFNVILNETANVTWYINGTEVFNQTSVTESTYTNTSAAQGTWNVTVVAKNANGTDMHTWTWIVKPQTTVGNISGMKFNDPNGNGKKDPGEPGLAGWHIKLVGVDTLTNTPVNREEITDANGNYRFMDVGPGIYQVFEVMQGPNWVPTTPVTVPINLKAGESINVNFGNKQIP